MKLSFVIPAHNEEAYIDKCLASIREEIKKHHYEVEVIVVNNASTDDTKAVVSLFPDVLVVDEHQKGLTRARHAGFLASSGDLIANIDADTILPEGWLPKVMDEFSKDPDLIALSGPFIYYDLSDNINLWVRGFYLVGFMSYLINRFVFRFGSMLQGGNFVITRQALEKIGGYNLEFDFWGEDTEIAQRLHKIGKIKFTFKLPIYASGRRLKGEGIAKMAIRYATNYLWTTFFKKPLSKTWSDIRLSEPERHISEARTAFQKGMFKRAAVSFTLMGVTVFSISLYVFAIFTQNTGNSQALMANIKQQIAININLRTLKSEFPRINAFIKELQLK